MKIQSKLLLLCAVPTLMVIILSAAMIQKQWSAVRASWVALDVQALTEPVANLVVELQNERVQASRGLKGAAADLELYRSRIAGTEAAISTIQLASLARTPELNSAISRVHDCLSKVRAQRQLILGGKAELKDCLAVYDAVGDELLNLIGHIIETADDTEFHLEASSLRHLLSCIEYATREHVIVNSILQDNTLSISSFKYWQATQLLQELNLREVADDFVDPQVAEELFKFDQSPANAEVIALRSEIEKMVRGQPLEGSADKWFPAVNNRMDELKRLRANLTARNQSWVAGRCQSQQQSLALQFAALFGTILLTITFSYYFCHYQFIRPLRQLTTIANQLAAGTVQTEH